MSTSAFAVPVDRPAFSVHCYWRPIILVAGAAAILCTFWFWSRYPALFNKAAHVGKAVPTMTYTSEVIHVDANAAVGWKILAMSVNWLNGMKVGMTFGVLFGALLHTVLRYYPLKIGRNLYLNSLKGALIGVPAGVCANCAVPVACGVTRGHGRVEVALGFLFSSPTLNPVVMAMTFAAFPFAMGLTKYLLVAGVILVVVPLLIRALEKNKPLPALETGGACEIPAASDRCEEGFFKVLGEMLSQYGRNVWMLVKPTLTLMVLASVVSAALLILVPWSSLLSEVTPLRAAALSLLSVLMPVPIALDVMFPAQLLQQNIPAGYVMMFTTTLGTFSVLPAIYLWRDVSKRLALALVGFFFMAGWILAMTF